MQLIKLHSIVVINHTGALGRVSEITIIYPEGQPPKTAIKVEFLLDAGFEFYSPGEIALRTNDLWEIQQHMCMEADSKFEYVDPAKVF